MSGNGSIRNERNRLRPSTLSSAQNQTRSLPANCCLYEASAPNTIVDGLLSRKILAPTSGKRPPRRDSWRTKETVKLKIARARPSARATAVSTSASGKPARCPSRASKPAPSRNAASIGTAPPACATSTSPPSTARRVTPLLQRPQPKRHPPQLLRPDAATASASTPASCGH
jgi:hypothetical protein